MENNLSKKALPLFFVGILLSTFVGGAIRAFFSPRQIEVWVSETLEKENPAFDLSFSEGRLSLSKNSIPRLGLVFHQVHLQPKDFCKLNAELFVKQLYLPVQLTDFFRGHLKFRQIEADGAELNLGVGNCIAPLKKEQEEESIAALTPPVKAEQKALLEFFRGRWRTEMLNTSSRTQGLRISELKVREAEKPVLTIRALNLDTSSPKTFELSAVVNFHRMQGFVESFSPTRLQVSVDADTLKLKVSQQIREGLLDLKAEILLNSLLFNSELSLSHIPSRPLFDMIVKNGWSKNNLNWPRQSWLSGNLQLSGNLNEPKETRFLFKDWKFEGDLGSLKLKKGEIKALSEAAWEEPLNIELVALKMDPTFNLLEYHKLKGLFQSFGSFKGHLLIRDPKTFDLIGEWEEMELKFSRADVRQTQKFSFDSKLSRQDGRWSGEINQVEVENGSFKGEVSFNFDEATWSGPVQIKIEELSLSPSVQQLMLGGKGSPLELYGQAALSEGRVESGNLMLGTQQLGNSRWQASGLKVKAKLNHQEVEAKLSLQELWLSQDHSYFKDIKPLYLDPQLADKLVDSKLRWKDLSARFLIDERGVSWKRGVARDTQHKAVFASEGKWSLSQKIDGWVSVDFPSYKLLKWELAGSPRLPHLEPSKKMLRELKRSHPDLNVNDLLPKLTTFK